MISPCSAPFTALYRLLAGVKPILPVQPVSLCSELNSQRRLSGWLGFYLVAWSDFICYLISTFPAWRWTSSNLSISGFSVGNVMQMKFQQTKNLWDALLARGRGRQEIPQTHETQTEFYGGNRKKGNSTHIKYSFFITSLGCAWSHFTYQVIGTRQFNINRSDEALFFILVAACFPDLLLNHIMCCLSVYGPEVRASITDLSTLL